MSRKNVVVGGHYAPAWEVVTPMLNRLQQVYGSANDPRSQLLASMAYHHRLAFVHRFEDGNGRVVRMATHLQLARIGLGSSLWSISRGLARKQDEYYARLSAADQGRRGDLDGRGQLTQAGLVEFVRFMLSVCKDQIQYTREAMAMPILRERLARIVQFEPRFIRAGIKPEGARAVYLLIIQGEVTRADFKAYFNLLDKTAANQLKELLLLGVVEAPSPKSRDLYPGFPVWFAQLLFPDLHRRSRSSFLGECFLATSTALPPAVSPDPARCPVPSWTAAVSPAPAVLSEQHPLPDWSWVHAELRRSGVPLALLWQEYR